VNSEELERSLRSEFENYLKGVIAEMRQETAEFRERISSEFDKQKAAVDEAVSAFTARLESENQFDEAFIGTVAEHLRLARDEGAKITANAFAEAEKLEKETAAPIASFDVIRDAVNDISTKDSQSAILKALVDHAGSFAPRGAFFIIKNEHLAGWKVFGDATGAAETAIREVHYPVASDSILGRAVRENQTIDSAAGAHAEDDAFLEPLHFGRPDRMYAIPLLARGKAVAVLYADYGTDGKHLQREGLETLVRVAGLTVELLAAAGAGHATATEAPQEQPVTGEQPSAAGDHDPSYAEQSAGESATDFSFGDGAQYEGGFPQAETAPESATEFDSWQHTEIPEATAAFEAPAAEPAFDGSAPAFGQPEAAESTEDIQPEVPAEEPAAAEEEASSQGSTGFDTGGSIEPAGFPEPEHSPFQRPAHQSPSQFEPAPAAASPFGNFEASPAEAVKSVVPVAGSRLSDRPVDLPIEVPEEERRSHNDARRFARLLVSEIKLYNEKKVLEGRQSRDLYDRLKEAVDRSREMYDKRVQPPVAAKFDYFHYELVNSLADGEPGRLGSTYPGPTV
jgi:hypothetical protein